MLYAGTRTGRASALEGAAKATFELAQAAELLERGHVLLAAACSERARSPIEATEGRSPLPIGALSPRAASRRNRRGCRRRLGDDLQLALRVMERDQRLLADRRLGEDDPLAVDALCAQIFERERALILGPHGEGRGRVRG